MNEFVTQHPWFALLFAVLAAIIIESVLHGIIEITNRIIRHFNIRKAGWPPAHCDADGDVK